MLVTSDMPLPIGKTGWRPQDILISFSTGFYSTGQLVVDRWRIAKNYATRWLLFDLTYVPWASEA